MASKQKPKITPRGVFIYPHFHAPDTKFDKDGVYRTKLQLSEEAGQPLVDEIEAAIKEQLAKAQKEFTEDPKNKGKSFKNSKLAKITDKPYSIGEGDDAGTISFNFKMKASGKRKKDGKEWSRSLALFDATGAPIPVGTKVGGGSEGKVAYTLNPFSTAIGTGVSLRLESAQIIVLREFSRSAESFGFEAEEGFSVNETEETTGAEEEAGDGDKAAGADF